MHGNHPVAQENASEFVPSQDAIEVLHAHSISAERSTLFGRYRALEYFGPDRTES